jgi:hypothetical protein
MKQILVVIIIFLHVNISNAQEMKYSGIVRDSETGIGIPFASVVSYIGNWVNGVYCDSLGYFSITINNQPDSICISSIGYQTCQVKVHEISDKLHSIKLKPKIYSLATVIIKPRREKIVGLIHSIRPEKNHGAPGTIRASYINNNVYKNAYIKEIIYNVNRDKGYSENCMEMVRVHLYQFNTRDSMPGKELLPENVIVYINSKTPLPLKVDVSKYNIDFPDEGIIVGYEYLGAFDRNKKSVSFKTCQDLTLTTFNSRNPLRKSFTYNLINGKRDWTIYYTDRGLFNYFPFGLTIKYTL